MTDTFTWDHLSEPAGTITGRVKRNQFGDGYSQRTTDGLNTKSDSWPLSFAGTEEDMEPLMAFLDDHIGASFFWTPPRRNAPQGYYTCDSYQLVPYGNGDCQVTATFNQEFFP